MKCFFLVYNYLTSSYQLAEGADYNTRRFISEYRKLDEAGLVSKLREEINKGTLDLKRKSALALVEVPEEVEKRVQDLFKDSKIGVMPKFKP